MTYIKFLRSAVAGKVPTTSDLDLGELAINTYDGKLFIKKDNGTQSIVDITAGGGGGSGTVTSVSGTGTVSGLSLSGTVTTSGSLTLGGTLSLTSSDITTGLGFTPYNATNPAGYTTNLGTVTSVAALTLGTSGTDVSSTVANGTTTPVITLNLPTASATNRGLLSAADWSVFNSKAASGANSDITSMTGITGGISSPDFVQFDTSATVTPAAGRLYFNDGEGGLSYMLKGGNVVQEIGQSQQVLVYNGTGATLNKGDVVYSNGAQGQRITVALALASSDATSARTLGIVAESIANGAEGWVSTLGIIENINTAAFTAGAQLYLSGTTPGGLTQTKPSAPIHLVYVARCIKSHTSSGRLFITVQNGYELDEIHDVKITGTPTAGSLIIRNATDSLWENARLTAGTGISITNADAGITITNSAPDQTVALTGSGTTSVSGTYPNFTISSADQYVGTVTSVSGTGTVNGITLTGSITSSGSLTLGGTLSGVSLTSQVSGTLPVANGGTGQTSYTDGQLLIGNSTGNTLDKATLTAGSGISITNAGGSITIAATAGGGGTVTSVGLSVPTGFTVGSSPVTTSGTIALGYSSGYALPTITDVANGVTAYGWGNHASAGYLTASSTIDGGTF